MTAAPPDAQMSPDGHYWWDEPNQTWQAVAAAASSSSADAAASSQPADPAEQGGYAQAEHLDVAGVCQAGELTDEEIAQVLSDAGVSVAEA